MSSKPLHCNALLSRTEQEALKVCTDSALRGAAAAAGLPHVYPQSTGDTVTVPCVGVWSLRSTQLVDISMQHVRCGEIRLGDTTFTGQDPCRVVETIADSLQRGLVSHQVTPKAIAAFWCALTGSSAAAPTTTVEAVSALAKFYSSRGACGQHSGVIQQSTLDNIVFAASADVVCSTLNLALNNCSSSVMCIIHGIANAQRQVAPQSVTAQPAVAPPSPPWHLSLILGVMAAFLVALVLTVAVLVSVAKRRRRHMLALPDGLHDAALRHALVSM